jgi:ABC-type maltose transport system permease subunit
VWIRLRIIGGIYVATGTCRLWQHLFAASIFTAFPVVILFMPSRKNLTDGGVKG